MINYWKLAWRNLWRNKRRTIITLTSVFLAVLLAICMRSIQLGAYENMISNAVRFSTGYIQIHSDGYWSEPSLNNSFEENDTLNKILLEEKNVSLSAPHLESFALASYRQNTKGIKVIGIDPKKEDDMNKLSEKITEGAYFKSNADNSILIGDGLASFLHLSLKDTLVLLGQGFHGSTAAGTFIVEGIFKYPVEQMNNAMVYLTKESAQTFFGAKGRITSLSIMLENPQKLEKTLRSLKKRITGNSWEIMKWQQMNSTLLQEIEGDNAGGIIMLAILYIVIAFGIFGTLLMMTMERRKEFAVMNAIGMKRIQLIWLLLTETLFIAILGICAGVALALPLIIYLNVNPIELSGSAAKAYEQFGIEPIMPASLDIHIFTYQAITVLFLSLLSALYPLVYLGRFKILTALK